MECIVGHDKTSTLHVLQDVSLKENHVGIYLNYIQRIMDDLHMALPAKYCMVMFLVHVMKAFD